MSTLLSANISNGMIVDIVIAAFIGLFLIIGLIRGFSKSFKGLFLAVSIILISITLSSFTTAPVSEMQFVGKLNTALVQKSETWGKTFTSPVYMNPDGTYYCDVDGENVPLKEVDGGIKGFIGNLAASKLIDQNTEGSRLAEQVVEMIVALIISVGLFLAYAIALGILAAIIRKLTERMHVSKNKGVRVVDKLLGGIISAVLSFLFVWFVFAIFKIFEDKMSVVTDAIQESTLGGFMYEKNAIGFILSLIF